MKSITYFKKLFGPPASGVGFVGVVGKRRLSADFRCVPKPTGGVPIAFWLRLIPQRKRDSVWESFGAGPLP